MSDKSAQLLARLGDGVRPFDVADPGVIGSSDLDFTAMLSRARAGNVETGLAVKLPNDLERELDAEQRSLLASAIDRAAVAGAESALIRVATRIVRVDVRTRVVVEEIDPAQTDPVLGIDALVQTDANDSSDGIADAPASGGVVRSARGVRNASLVRALPDDASL